MTSTRNVVQLSRQAVIDWRTRDLKVTQQELAGMAGVSVSTISRIERTEAGAGIHGKNFRKLAEAVKMNPDELARRLGVPGSKPPVDPEFPSGIGRIMTAKLAPHYEGGLSASRTSEVGERKPERLIPLPVDGRVFTVNVDGECMIPDYLPGEIVVFSYDAIERDGGIIDGEAYYIQLSDDTGTFKLVNRVEHDVESFNLSCINAKKFPKLIRVHQQEIVRVAKAVGKYQPIQPRSSDGSERSAAATGRSKSTAGKRP